MTKIIKSMAVIAPLFILTGSYFKFSHWPGADILYASGLAAGIIFFFLLIASFRGKGPGGFEQFTRIFAAATISVVLLAFMFKLFHLAGAAKLIWIADSGLLLSCIFFIIDGLMEKDPVKWALKFISAFFIVILIAMILLIS